MTWTWIQANRNRGERVSSHISVCGCDGWDGGWNRSVQARGPNTMFLSYAVGAGSRTGLAAGPE